MNNDIKSNFTLISKNNEEQKKSFKIINDKSHIMDKSQHENSSNLSNNQYPIIFIC